MDTQTKKLKREDEEKLREYEWQVERLKRALPKANVLTVADINEVIEWYERKISAIKIGE